MPQQTRCAQAVKRAFCAILTLAILCLTGGAVFAAGEAVSAPHVSVPPAPAGVSTQLSTATVRDNAPADTVSLSTSPARGGGSGAADRAAGRVGEERGVDPGPSIEGGGLFQALSGNVGIGTKKPRAKLEVRGDVLITGELRVEGRNSNSKGRDCLRVAFDTSGAAVYGEGFSVAGIWKAGKTRLETGGVVCCK